MTLYVPQSFELFSIGYKSRLKCMLNKCKQLFGLDYYLPHIFLNRWWKRNNSTTTSCKSSWDTAPYFGFNGVFMILCLWSPLHPLSKLLAIHDHAQNLEEQLCMRGRREVSIIHVSHSLVTSSDLKQESSFFCRNVSTFLQLVVHVASNQWHFRIKCVKTIYSQMTNIFGYHRILKVVQWFCAPENIRRHYMFYDCFSLKDPNWRHCLNRVDWQRDKS